VAARAHLDLDPLVLQEVPVPEEIVDGGDLEVQVAQARPVTLEDGELVVHRVDAQQAGPVANPVRDPGVEASAPVPVGVVDVGSVQAQVPELGNPGGPAERDRPGDLHLVVVDMFTADPAPGHQERSVAGPHGGQRRTNSGVGDHEVSLAHGREQVGGRKELDRLDPETRGVGVSGLPEDVSPLRKDPEQAFNQRAEGVVVRSERDHHPMDLGASAVCTGLTRRRTVRIED